MIVELDPPDPPQSARRRWLLPALAGAALLVALLPRFAASLPAPAPPSPIRASRPAILAQPGIAQVTRLPTIVGRADARVSRIAVPGVTGLVPASAYGEEWFLIRFADGRDARLVRLPATEAAAPRDGFDREDTSVRGFPGYRLRPTRRGLWPVVVWGDLTGAHELFSKNLTADELLLLAQRVRD